MKARLVKALLQYLRLLLCLSYLHLASFVLVVGLKLPRLLSRVEKDLGDHKLMDSVAEHRQLAYFDINFYLWFT